MPDFICQALGFCSRPRRSQAITIEGRARGTIREGLRHKSSRDSVRTFAFSIDLMLMLTICQKYSSSIFLSFANLFSHHSCPPTPTSPVSLSLSDIRVLLSLFECVQKLCLSHTSCCFNSSLPFAVSINIA